MNHSTDRTSPTDTSNDLEPLRFPLFGSRLIEASAGTGKTYTIAALYVRLVLGHGGETAFSRPLTPPEILVVTFTDAATKELRDRIRKRLIESAHHFQADPGVASEDEFLQGLRAEYPHEQWSACARKLMLAAEWMDESAISTIHGWCHRMLREHAFESGSLFSQEFETDHDDLMEEVVRDYWRTFISPLGEGGIRELVSWSFGQPPNTYSITTPSNLHKAIDGLIGHAEVLEASDAPADSLAQNIEIRMEKLEEIKAPWRTWVGELRQLFDEAKAKKRFNGNKLQEKSYTSWFNQIEAWSHNPDAITLELKPKTGWSKLTPDELMDAWNDDNVPEHPAFVAMETLKDTLENLPSARNAVLSHAATWAAARFDQEQRRRAQMGHDDLLTRLHDALMGPNGQRLAQQVRRKFPVALIDEFQDTDPTQYRIFNAVYDIASNDSTSTIVLIGDPKQAIYAFRGADIYTYLEARKACNDRLYTLSRNYRSTKSMVKATNRCFELAESRTEGKGAFLFREDGQNPVPFIQARARGRQDKLWIDGSEPPAMTVWWLEKPEDAALSKGDYQSRMSEACASEIVRLLNLGQQGQAGFVSETVMRPLRPADVAVLVNSGKEANLVRSALSRRGVRSVYLSERGSVYESPHASEIMHWLEACAAPDNSGLLKAALATPTLGLDWAELNRVNNDELAWEDRVLQFRGYREIWRNRGVLPMLRLLLNDFSVPAQLLAKNWRGASDTITGERVLTDILHLAELLQESSEVLDGEHALIRHLSEQVRDASTAQSGDSRQIRLESDAGLVKVVTVHKSKGLEYPLVFLPFASSTRTVQPTDMPLLWHDEEGHLRVSLDNEDDIILSADEDRLGEDLRKLYVALTRAQYATWVGVGPISGGSNPPPARNAMGYLIGCERDRGSEGQRELLDELLKEQGEYVIRILDAPSQIEHQYIQVEEDQSGAGQARQAVRDLRQHWWITSYSSITAHHGAAPAAPETPAEDQVQEQGEPVDRVPEKSTAPRGGHAFPRGADAGSFLHSLLEWMAQEGFANTAAHPERLRDMIARRCALRDWTAWIDPLTEWMSDILSMPLTLPEGHGSVMLKDLNTYQAEMEFWFSIHEAQTDELDRLVQEFTLDGAARPQLTPNMLNGMLKGFIDLVFEHEGRYYVADYKSNWLGADDTAYTPEAMRAAILSSRYELQYVIYMFALHRLLKARLPDYDFERHIGGTAYLFLRGTHAPEHGVHVERPPKELFEMLDDLFSYSTERSAA